MSHDPDVPPPDLAPEMSNRAYFAWLRGRPVRKCGHCAGSGKIHVTCSRCDGDGTKSCSECEQDVDCDFCDGKGCETRRCRRCDEGLVEIDQPGDRCSGTEELFR